MKKYNQLLRNVTELIEKGLFKLSLDRKVVLPHHKTFELVDEMRNTVKKSLELIEND